ncbi:NUDIX domain-containing protein [Rhodovulum sp. BSW8]|uniref:NUDIX hydrolase n=1 Tax=Rhodovulum visakhapatnamense TaxID=364297 RepID=A0ABS1RAA8_9RHOB|nr:MULTISPECIES: NUDIX hydrolase [Rhodovulum]MBL3568281.1 NUDIX hydrolase [Rhodovulum visakhapatnamense]MBL3576581.1 NUDIX hydrolase [Rhodovulum visakhapatnamense]OLS43229.1 NUDIX hydrolase [Rhodovulum sulfidophilum]RBO53250.1 NUDIX domain-containing protein [Rhodovulum sp. BSW8]
MIRRFGEAVRADQSYKLRQGAYALLERDGLLLVTHQQRPVPEYQLPGGGIDPGESPLQALHREVFEETGWKIELRRRLGAFRRFTYMPEYDIWAEKLCTIYLGRPVRPYGPPSEPGHTALWMPADVAARQLGNAGDRHAVRRWLGLAR